MKKILIVLTVLFLTACGAKSASGGYSNDAYAPAAGAYYEAKSEAYDEEYAAEAETAAMIYDEEGIGTSASGKEFTQIEEKIVYTGNLTVETKNYEDSVRLLNEKITRYGAMTASSDESARSSGLRSLYIQVRVPSASFHDFMGGASDLGNIRSQSTNRNDITRQYNDRSIEAEALEVQQEKLLEMLEKAETIEEMLMIEDRLVSVQTRLNQLKSVIGNMDMDVAYSTVHIYLNEVVQYSSDIVERKDETFADRLKNAFQDSWDITTEVLESIFFTLIRFAPLLVIAALLAGLYRNIRRRHPGKPSLRLFRRKKNETADITSDEMNHPQG